MIQLKNQCPHSFEATCEGYIITLQDKRTVRINETPELIIEAVLGGIKVK